MRYCLLIQISRTFISFSYNKEGDKGFIPYGEELVKPLAVYCQGNEISIGKFALLEAQNGNKYAHANLFDAISSTELIEYKGQKHDINKLLFFAMEKYIAEFFDKILMRSEGSLEGNRAHFPVVVLFNPDLRFYERDYVVKSLQEGGYGNLLSIYASSLFEKVVCSKIAEGTIPIFVGGDGLNLYCESDKRRFPEIVTMEKIGIDPRIGRALRIMLNDIVHQGYDEYRSDKGSDMQLLRKRAVDFLNTLKREQMFSVMLSDGFTYDLFLKKSDFGMSGGVSDEALVAFSKLKTLLEASGTQTSQCCIILTDREVVTEYVEKLFHHYFSNIISVNDEQRLRAMQILVDKVVSQGYVFRDGSKEDPIVRNADEAFKAGKFKEAREMYKAMSSTVAEGKIANCTSCIKDERRIREFYSLPVETQSRMRTEILDIFSKWAEMGVGDDYISRQKEKLEKTTNNPIPPPPPPPPPPPVDERKIRREWREVRAQANGFIREGKPTEAKKELTAFVTRYKDKGVDLSEAEQMLAGLGGEVPAGKLPLESEGYRLMKESKFKEAKAWYANNGFTSKAGDCSTLIKAVRNLKAYKAEIQSISNNHNVQLAKSHLEDMRGWRAVYVKYNMDTKEIDEIINSYKSIK